MSVSTPESSKTPQSKGPDFRKVGENLYRLNTSGKYYALLKRGGKQYRKSLKTTDKELAKRRLGELREKVGQQMVFSAYRKAVLKSQAADCFNIRTEAKPWVEIKGMGIKKPLKAEQQLAA